MIEKKTINLCQEETFTGKLNWYFTLDQNFRGKTLNLCGFDENVFIYSVQHWQYSEPTHYEKDVRSLSSHLLKVVWVQSVLQMENYFSEQRCVFI